MDRFTRNYSLGLGLIVLAALALWGHSTWQPRVWEINQLLVADPLVANYPYQFRAVSMDNGVVTLLTPRSSAVPAYQFVQIIHPELAGKAQDDPGMIKAQADLVNSQRRVMDLVGALPDVKKIAWTLDLRWLADHGVQPPTGQ
ncbi:hypothetical protein [uncultured Thiodictyon sp.]|uniref:hypothetical protein n=1 Tax=uncultured Thiodictyon sp. TaxID=1846217 RepID=UPI0025E9CEA0|nr:hypothetical protein [uncultured Thiodictyon sp.]